MLIVANLWVDTLLRKKAVILFEILLKTPYYTNTTTTLLLLIINYLVTIENIIFFYLYPLKKYWKFYCRLNSNLLSQNGIDNNNGCRTWHCHFLASQYCETKQKKTAIQKRIISLTTWVWSLASPPSSQSWSKIGRIQIWATLIDHNYFFKGFVNNETWLCSFIEYSK